MRTAAEIYETYHIPPWLQLHQLRVAAVGKMVVESIQTPVDHDAIITACLLHDIGAIVKFDFSKNDGTMRGLLAPEDVAHWQEVQRVMRKKYGDGEHPATDAILIELGVSESVRTIINESGLEKMQAMIAHDHVAVQILQYADMRVAPYGVDSTHKRLEDVRERYGDRLRAAGKYDTFREHFDCARTIEERLFAGATIRPESISDSTIAPHIETLKKYAIS